MFHIWELIDNEQIEHYDVPILGTNYMRLLGRDKLEKLASVEPSYKRWLDAWSSELTRANWMSSEEVSLQFPKVATVNGQVFNFKIEGSDIYIETFIYFNKLVVLITSVKGNRNGY